MDSGSRKIIPNPQADANTQPGISSTGASRPAGQAELGNLDERMRSIVDHVADGIICIDERGTIGTFNRAAERIFGYGAQQVIGQNVRLLMPEPCRNEHDSDIASYLGTDTAGMFGVDREVAGRRRDGMVFPMALAVTEFRHANQRHFTAVIRDITDRKRAEEARREAEERMRSVVDHVLDAIITTDADARIEAFNPAAQKLFGYSQDEVVGRNVSVLMPSPEREQHDGHVKSYLATGQGRIIGIGREVVGCRKDGSTFPMELAVSEFQVGSRRYFTGIARDITERKRLEHELRQRVQELAEADRQKNEFLAMLGHELRNPLAPMRNALYVLKMPAAAAAAEQAREIIDRQLQHLVRLVDDLLDVSRIVRGKVELQREVIDLREAVRRARETAQPIIDAHGHRLAVNLTAQPCWIEGDQVRLAQAIANLLINAAKYTEHPGTVFLSLEAADEGATVRVRDHGVGIAPEFLPKIFDLFVQGDPPLARSKGGLGIGLTLVRKLVELHHGKVSASSAGPGQGSEFVITLPVASAPASSAGEGATNAGPANQGGTPWKVLVVDDNVDACESLAMLLMTYGYDVRCLHDGSSVLPAAMQWRPDVIILDIGLPGMSGFEVSAQLRQHPQFQSTPIAALTGYGQDDDRLRSRQAGFDVHLTKPVDPQALRRLLFEMLDPAAKNDGA